jgi:hypothetical protein
MFKDLFPAKVFYDRLNYSEYKDSLERAKTIHPELIYYEIRKMQTQYKDNGQFTKQVVSEQTAYIWNKFLTDKKSWTDTVRNDITATKLSFKLKQNILKKLKIMMISPSQPEKEIKMEFIENNLKDFVVWKFYQKDKNLRYDPSISYTQKRIEFEQKKRLHFREICSQIDQNAGKANLQQTDEFLNWWYLFQTPDEWTTLSMEPSEYIQNVYKSYYSIKNIYKLSLGISYGVRYGFPIKCNIKDFISYPATIKRNYSCQQVRFVVSSKIPLNAYIGLLSFINISIDYAQSTSGKNISIIPAYKHTFVNSTTTVKLFDYEIDNIHTKMLMIQATTPFYFPTNRCFFEFGLTSGFWSMSYEIKHDLNTLYFVETDRKIEVVNVNPWIEKIDL